MYDGAFSVSLAQGDAAARRAFIWENQFQLVQELRIAEFALRRRAKRFLAVAVLDLASREQLRGFEGIVRALAVPARLHLPEFGVGWIDARQIERHAGLYGLTSFPAVVVLDSRLRDDCFFVTHNLDGLSDWFAAIRAGTVDPDSVPRARLLWMRLRVALTRNVVTATVCAALVVAFVAVFWVFVREWRVLRRRKRRAYQQVRLQKRE